ncbi:MAG: sodium-dependent bicarbonate transport family permease, partial [Actinomycetota bacterium]
MAGLLAVLEIIGIVVALFLARRSNAGDGWKSALSEVVRGRSIA